MSYVGEPFEFDVFVSYARAEQETEAPAMRLWCRHVAESLRSSLASALNVGDVVSRVQLFLDDRVLTSGQPPTETLRDKVQRSALLLILMSPLYARKSWCLDELGWFFEQADRDGRGQHHCTVLLVQPLPDENWPKRLRDQRNKPVVFHNLVDREAGLPIGFHSYGLQALSDALRQIHIELKGKLETLRNQLEARRVYQQSAVPPVHPVLYLQARRQDFLDWQAARTELEPHAIVNPPCLPEPLGDDALLQAERERRLAEYAECDGLVLLRATPDDTFNVEVMAAYKDRQRLFQQRRRSIPWVIADRHGSASPVYSAYRVPCVPATGPDWPRHLVRTLCLDTHHPS